MLAGVDHPLAGRQQVGHVGFDHHGGQAGRVEQLLLGQIWHVAVAGQLPCGGRQLRIGFDDADDLEIRRGPQDLHFPLGVGMSGADLADFDAFHVYLLRKDRGGLACGGKSPLHKVLRHGLGWRFGR